MPTGKTYRLRLLGGSSNWFYRVFIENHDMRIISITGEDVAPFHAKNGIELAPGDRYDVLVTFNQRHNSKHWLRIERYVCMYVWMNGWMHGCHSFTDAVVPQT